MDVFGVRENQALVVTLSVAYPFYDMTLVINFSKIQFPHMSTGNNDTALDGML